MSNENIRVLKCKIRGHMQHIDMMHFDDNTFWRRLGSSMYLSICLFSSSSYCAGFFFKCCSFKVTPCKDAEVFGNPSLPSATRVIPPDLPSRRLADLSRPVIGLCWPIHFEDRKDVHPSLLFSPLASCFYCINVLLSQCLASHADMDWTLPTLPEAVGEAIYLQGERRVLAN